MAGALELGMAAPTYLQGERLRVCKSRWYCSVAYAARLNAVSTSNSGENAIASVNNPATDPEHACAWAPEVYDPTSPPLPLPGVVRCMPSFAV